MSGLVLVHHHTNGLSAEQFACKYINHCVSFHHTSTAQGNCNITHCCCLTTVMLYYAGYKCNIGWQYMSCCAVKFLHCIDCFMRYANYNSCVHHFVLPGCAIQNMVFDRKAMISCISITNWKAFKHV